MTSDLQKRFKSYGTALEEDQKLRDVAFTIDKRTTQLAKKMVFAVHRHGNTSILEKDVLREFRRAPFAARFRYGYLLANAREEYLEAVLLREFVGQVEETRAGTRTEVTLASIIRAIDPGARDNNNSSEANKGDSDLNDGNAGGRRGSYGSNDSTGSDTTLAAQLGDDDRAAETLLLALLDFSGELARLGTIETARYGWPALAVAQDLLWHTRELAPYAHDASVRRFDAKLATLRVSVGKLERLLTLACVTTPQTTVAPLSGSAPAADPSVSSKALSDPAVRPPGAFSMVDAGMASRFQDHSV